MIHPTPRVRFAPSPTGYLHVGGLRTALYNYLFAKKNNGTFILRIEDTDRNRYVEGAVENLITTLKWIGLNYDEGPDNSGEYSPYYQSQRLNIYKEYANVLLTQKNAYRCFCTAERLTQLREAQQKEKHQAKYDKHCLNLTQEEIDNKLETDTPFVVRLNVPEKKTIKFDDVVRQHIEFSSDTVDDQILIKSDGYPTYHLANVVDDHLMKITHVIRGEEWLPSTPKHVLLYDFFGWERPVFAHLPLLLNPDKSKLSKRQGDVAVEDYRGKGYLKESLINFVALLGWNAGDDREFYYLNELEEHFSLERVNKSGAVFNVEKLNWLNFEHLRQKPVSEVLLMLKEELSKTKFGKNVYTDNYLIQVIDAMRERVSFVKEYAEKSPYFFEAPEEYDTDIIKKRWKDDSPALLKKLADNISEFQANASKDDFEHALHKTAEEAGVGAGKLIHPVRLAASGMGVGPGVYDLLVVLGKDEVVKRINTAIEKIKI
ncbi:MAG: glutamate--tRNA ligase [Ignavibacteriaceae bacterium]|nr:glutamate--tRNA ligase [Ignavibacteriaceae bacterium]